MKLVFIIALVGLFGFAAVAFLLNKARGALAKEREAEKITLSNDERIRETANWLGAYVGYYEYDGGLFVFLDEMRVNESDTPIDKVYAALEEVGAGALVPPLQRMAAAYQESFQRTANLDTFREEDEVNRIEAEYGGVYAQAENEISRSGLRVYDILQAYEKEHADVLNKARS